MADNIKQLDTSILGLQGTMQTFIESLTKQQEKMDKASDASKKLGSFQKKLNLSLDKTKKLVNSSGAFVNEYGKEISKTGEQLGNFNKRSQIMNTTVASFTKQGKAVSFLQGYAKYVELGGSRLEFFAEYLSSAREELTVFGLEASKARKFMYGFLPPGMFRLINKFSSGFQFLGGTLRKMKDNGKGAKDQLEELKETLETAKGMNESQEMLDNIQNSIKELEKNDNPNILTNVIKGFTKISDFLSKPIQAKGTFDEVKKQYDTTIEGKLFGDGFIKGIFKTATLKGQIKKRVKEGGKQFNDEVGRYKKKLGKNFGMNLTPDKKDELKRLKGNIKTLRKPIKDWIAGAEQARGAKASLLGVTDKDVKKTKKAYETITQNVKDMEANLVAVSVANPAMAGNFRKTLDKLKQDQKDAHVSMLGAENDYEQQVLDIAGKVDSYDPNIQRLKDFEKFTAEASALEDEGIQGTRKKYRDLYKDTTKMQRIFNEGMNPEEIIENQKELLVLSKTMVTMTRATEEAEKMAEAWLVTSEMTGSAEDFEKYVKQAEHLENLLEAREGLESKILGVKLQEKGKNSLNDEIKANDVIIKQSKQKIIDMETAIKYQKKQINDARQQFDSGVITGSELKEAEESGELNIDGARTNIENAEQNMKGAEKGNTAAGEQLDVLKDMKAKASEKLLSKFPVLGFVFKIFKGLKAFPGLIMRILSAAGKYFLVISLAVIGALIIIKKILPAIKDVWSNIITTVAPLLDFVVKSASIFFEGFMKVFNAFFGDGSISGAIDGLIEMAWGLLRISLGLAMLGLSIALMLLWELTKVLWDKTINYIYGMLTDSKKFLKRIGVVIAVIGIIVSLILGAPVWLALVIGVVLWKATKPVIKMFRWLADKLNPSKWFGGGKAKGGMTDGRINLVGEEGPELVQLPKGSNVFSNSQSKKMIGGNTENQVNTNHTHNYNITINAKDTSKAEMRRMADEIGKMVNSQIKRSVGR
tara:strand:- start:9355 stop:12309 length:2955 start_codon:yes stop_codon:yes gene_type:complete